MVFIFNKILTYFSMEEMMNQYLLYVVLTTVQKSAWEIYYFVYDEIVILGFSFESFNRNAVAF